MFMPWLCRGVLVCALLGGGAAWAADSGPDNAASDDSVEAAAELIRRAKQIHDSDSARFAAVTVVGRVEFVLADGTEFFTCQARYQRRGRLLFLDLLKLESVPPDRFFGDRVQLVGDGEVLASRCFSPRIHPVGCNTSLDLDTKNFVAVYRPVAG